MESCHLISKLLLINWWIDNWFHWIKTLTFNSEYLNIKVNNYNKNSENRFQENLSASINWRSFGEQIDCLNLENNETEDLIY